MITKCGIIGLGAVGGMYAKYLTEMLSKEYVYCICDENRLKKYQSQGIIVNGSKFDFNYTSTKTPMDLIIIATKFNQLEDALDTLEGFVGENTIILTAINGVVSEEITAKRFGWDKVLYCVVQGMDSVKVGNEITYSQMGVMSFGNKINSEYSRKIKDVAEFFELSGFNYEIPFNMEKRMWGKFMMNTGVNQTCAAFDVPYGGYQKEGEIRNIYIAAMKEALEVAKAHGIDLTNDFDYWLNLGDRLTPDSMPSMRQDVLAKRKTEKELFGGTVIKLGKKYGIETPVNNMLMEKIEEIERGY